MAALALVTARPFCRVCKRPVEHFEEREDPAFDRVVFVARCHGQTERVELTSAEVSADIDFGLAFRGHKLLMPPAVSVRWPFDP